MPALACLLRRCCSSAAHHSLHDRPVSLGVSRYGRRSSNAPGIRSQTRACLPCAHTDCLLLAPRARAGTGCIGAMVGGTTVGGATGRDATGGCGSSGGGTPQTGAQGAVLACRVAPQRWPALRGARCRLALQCPSSLVYPRVRVASPSRATRRGSFPNPDVACSVNTHAPQSSDAPLLHACHTGSL